MKVYTVLFENGTLHPEPMSEAAAESMSERFYGARVVVAEVDETAFVPRFETPFSVRIPVSSN